MQENTKQNNYIIKFGIAVILCFVAVYFTEITLGAVATIPFILLLPALAFMVYQKPLHIIGCSALAAFIFKCIFSAKASEIVLNVLFCAAMSSISVYTFKTFCDILKKKSKKKKAAVVFSILYIASLAIYILIYGTIFGNLSSKTLNREYLEKTYPDKDFVIGSTYFSVSDFRYVTEFDFTAKERYRALVSANDDGSAAIDGYRDLAESELLNKELENFRKALSSFAYEGSDFVIRPARIDTDDIITSDSSVDTYRDLMCYEIALYYQYSTEDQFIEECKSYIAHLDKYDSLRYKSIRFYGFSNNDSDDFTYTLDYEYGSEKFESKPFDKKNYERYFSEKDTHKYWELLG